MPKNSSENIQKRRNRIEVLINKEKFTLHDLSSKLREEGFEGVSKKSLKNDLKSLGYTISPDTNFIKKPSKKRENAQGELENIIYREITSCQVIKITSTSSTYSYNWDFEESSTYPERLIINENNNEDNYCIFLKFSARGYEQIVADLLYIIHHKQIKMITVGIGGIIIYTYDKNTSDKIIENIKRHI